MQPLPYTHEPVNRFASFRFSLDRQSRRRERVINWTRSIFLVTHIHPMLRQNIIASFHKVPRPPLPANILWTDDQVGCWLAKSVHIPWPVAGVVASKTDYYSTHHNSTIDLTGPLALHQSLKFTHPWWLTDIGSSPRDNSRKSKSANPVGNFFALNTISYFSSTPPQKLVFPQRQSC